MQVRQVKHSQVSESNPILVHLRELWVHVVCLVPRDPLVHVGRGASRSVSKYCELSGCGKSSREREGAVTCKVY